MFDLPVKSIIDRKKFLTAAPETTVAKAAQMMVKKNASAVVVIGSGERLLGIFTERDAVFRIIAAGLDPQTTPLAAVMTVSPKTVEASRPFGYALYMMHENGFRHLPVVENGKPIGIISSRKALDPDLEEFVSEAERRRQYANIAA